MENAFDDDAPVQLHFDVSHPPPHLQADDRPNQDITLTAAMSGAAAVENQTDRFHLLTKTTRKLDDMASIFNRKDKQSALKLLMGRRNEITLTDSAYVDEHDEDRLVWQVHSHYLDLRICVGSGLGLGAMLPNIGIHHALEFRLELHQRHRRFSAKYAKLGFDPTNCMMYIGRSSSGEDAWLAWLPIECIGKDGEEVERTTGGEDTVMSEEHYRMAVMFLSYALRSIGYRDVTVTDEYPDVTNDDDYRYATNAM